MPTDDATFEWTTDNEIIFGSLRGPKHNVLIFNRETGMLDVKERYDFYTPTQYRVSNESKIFGIVGVVDLCFKKYVLSVDRRELTASVKGKRIWKITGVRATQYYSGKPFLSLNEEELERTILGHITSMLTSGLFYYSVDMDLTSSCQATLEKESARENKWSSEKLTSAGADSLSELRKEFQMIDERFMFNKYLLDSILALETYPFILPTIFGFAASTEFLLDTVTHQYCLISRCSNKRAGTRYFRGLDEHGSSAIEVETEMILVSDDRLMSYRQLRGSTPLIWKSSAPDEILQPVHIDLTGSADQTSKNALHLHLFNLVERFQTPVTLLSLLSRKHKKESLAEQYQQLADAFSKVFHEIRGNLGTGQDVDLIEFDESDLVHAGKSSMQKLMKILEPVWTKHGFFSSIVGYTADMNLNASLTDSRQHGVLRINGIDCVDMTNVVQYNVALEVMYAMLASCGVPGKLTPSQLNKVKKVWVANGRALALLYTGVPRVLYEEQIRSNWIEFLLGATTWWLIVRVGRMYMGTFRDSRRQEAFECVLGQMRHTVKDAISVQKSVLKLATNQKSLLAFFMLVRRFFSPTHVNTVLNFVLGMGWLFAQAVVRVMVGEAVWASTALPRVGSKLDTSSLAKEQPDDSVGLNMELNRRKSQGLEELLKKSGDGNSMGTTPRTSATALLRKERRLTIS